MSQVKATKIDHLELREVEYMPDELEHGILYHSDRFNTAIHLCACGCGNQVVTPLAEKVGHIPLEGSKWGFQIDKNGPTLFGSIGNQNVCGAHYNVRDGRIEQA
jgi:Family of unknown function (DUF6527)